MNKFLTIMKREYAQVVKKKSFLIMTLLTPVIMAGFMIVPSFLMSKGMKSEAESYAVIDRDGNQLGEQLAVEMEHYTLDDDSTAAYSTAAIATPDSANYTAVYDSLVQSIRERELKYLLVLHPDAHLADTNRLLVTNSENRLTISRLEYRLSKVLSKRRLEESNINLPVDSVLALTARTNLPRQDTKGEYVNPMFKMLAGIILLMLIYLLILIDGQALMQSIIDEKTDRIMEVLVSSATPFQLMAGKILGTGLAALTQVGIWILAGVGVMLYSSSTGTAIDPAISRTVFNPATVVSFVLFLTSGYLLFSTCFAFIGSIVNSPKEAQSMILPLIMVLIAPGMLVGIAAMQFPDATWVKALSFVPPYTPLIMMTRVCSTAPTVEGNALLSPIMGEALIGFVLVILTTVGAIWITARVFRVGILMYGKRPNLPEIMKWIRHA
jgi:ABC-2 type transport system permease protein